MLNDLLEIIFEVQVGYVDTDVLGGHVLFSFVEFY